MTEEKPAIRPIRFGPFEADLQAKELRKRGVRVRLPDQPFTLLAELLQRPGEVVTREELQARLWPSNTFVDFDRGLNKAMNRVRETLNDSAEEPRYIETIPRCGYRFIGEIEPVLSSPAVQPSPAATVSAVPESPQPAAASRRWLLVAALVGTTLFASVALLVFRSRPGCLAAISVFSAPPSGNLISAAALCCLA
jgi:DNA-binding winged helix-turn-helix (wHTH) protein